MVREIEQAGGEAHAVAGNVASASSLADAFAEVKRLMPDRRLAVAVFNVNGRFGRKGVLEDDGGMYEDNLMAQGYVHPLSLVQDLECHFPAIEFKPS